jgi:hypothetical protein
MVYELDERAAQSVNTKDELASLRKTGFDGIDDEAGLSKLLSKQKLSITTVTELLKKFRCKAAIRLINDVLGDQIKPAFNTQTTAEVQESLTTELRPFTYKELSEYREDCLLSEGVAKLRALAQKSTYKDRHSTTEEHRRTAKHSEQRSRGMDRKTLGMTSTYNKVSSSPVPGNMFSASRQVEKAKQSAVDVGRWMITPGQAQWVAFRYHFNLPTAQSPIKHLSNTSIVLYRDRRGMYFLVKDTKLLHPKRRQRSF